VRCSASSFVEDAVSFVPEQNVMENSYIQGCTSLRAGALPFSQGSALVHRSCKYLPDRESSHLVHHLQQLRQPLLNKERTIKRCKEGMFKVCLMLAG
jgi:hypothetical protein